MTTVMNHIMINNNLNKQRKYNSEESIERRLREKNNRHICECGGYYSITKYSIHFKTNRHLKFILK